MFKFFQICNLSVHFFFNRSTFKVFSERPGSSHHSKSQEIRDRRNQNKKEKSLGTICWWCQPHQQSLERQHSTHRRQIPPPSAIKAVKILSVFLQNKSLSADLRRSRRRVTSAPWSGCGGSAPGSSSASWCRTRTASSGRRRRANRGPPRSRGPSGSSRKARGPGCSFPQLHLRVTWPLWAPGRRHATPCHATYCRARWRLPPPSSSGRRRWTGRLLKELGASRARRLCSLCSGRRPALWYESLLRSADMATLRSHDNNQTLQTPSWKIFEKFHFRHNS